MTRLSGLRALLVGVLIWALVSAASFGPGEGSGIRGRIQEGPTCPVEQQPPQPGCAPRPLAATLRIHPQEGRSGDVLSHSGTNGRFRVTLAPGTYVVHAERVHGSQFPRPPAPFQVVVRDDRMTQVTVTYDTGIR